MTQAELKNWINNSVLSSIWQKVSASQNSDAAHDTAHLLRVALWTIKLSNNEVPKEEAVAAALLHDLINIPKNHPDRSKASQFSADAARPLLKDTGFSTEAIERIACAIRDHSFSRGAIPESILGKALQDADRLEALGAIGIMRVFSTGARMDTKYFHENDPWAKDRALDDMKFSVDHFFTKLLKLPETFLTPLGKKEADYRANTLRDFLGKLSEEIGAPL